MQWNAKGVNSKKDGFSKRLNLEHILFNICCLQETHLSKEVSNLEAIGVLDLTELTEGKENHLY